jgi:hypothetical protein
MIAKPNKSHFSLCLLKIHFAHYLRHLDETRKKERQFFTIFILVLDPLQYLKLKH